MEKQKQIKDQSLSQNEFIKTFVLCFLIIFIVSIVLSTGARAFQGEILRQTTMTSQHPLYYIDYLGEWVHGKLS